MIALCFGMFTGLAEITLRLGRVVAVGSPIGASPKYLWMSPLAGGLVFLSAALIMLLGSWIARRPITLRVLVAALGTLTVYVLLRVWQLGVAPWAATILAAGVAFHLSRIPLRSPQTFRRGVRLGVLGMTALVCVVLLTSTLGKWSARRPLASGAPRDPGAASVVMLVLDTGRASSMSLYGSEIPTTPNLEARSEEAVVFDRAFSPSPWTLPAHASVFTGLWPHEHGATWSTRLGSEHQTLAERLAERGYATGGFVANSFYASTLSGLAQGFSTYADHPAGIGSVLRSFRITEASVQTVLERRTSARSDPRVKTAEDVNAEFLSWVDDIGDRPFFAFLNYMDVHSPYGLHTPFDTLFGPRPRVNAIRQTDWNNARANYGDDVPELLAAYHASFVYLDHQLELLFDALESRGILDEAIVVIVGDHGEQFGEHNLMGHGNSLYLPVLHVPLMIRAPGRVPSGARVADPVSTRDLAPTILDLLGIESEFSDDRSLRTTWSDSATGAADASVVLSEVLRNSSPTSRGVIHGRWHYVRMIEDGSEGAVRPRE